MGTEGRRLGYEYMYKYVIGKERFREFFVRKRIRLERGGGGTGFFAGSSYVKE